MKRTTRSERALVLAPHGRDAPLAVKLLEQAGFVAQSCPSLAGVLSELNAGAAFVIITEETLLTADLSGLSAWLRDQEQWSDLPFILLTHRGGLERNPDANRFLDILGNVTFLERPFHPTTLHSLARSALRSRRRQYEARERLEALMESEARFRAAVGAVQGVLWTNDAEGRMRGEQAGWAALTGQRREDYEGYGWTRAIYPDDIDPTIAAWETAVRQYTPFVHEHRVRSGLDGTWRNFSVRAIPSLGPDGRVHEWVGVHTDVTEQRRTETALRESEQRFRNMADHASVMMWVTDPTGNCTYLNRLWHDYTGQTVDEAAGFGWTMATHPDDRERVQETFVAANATQLPFRIEYRLRRSDGVYRWAIDAAAPRFGSDGEFLGYVGSVIDIDERKEIEDALRASEAGLRQLNAELERKVIERAQARGRTWQVSPDLMGALNADGYFETSNPAWMTVLGWSEAEVASRSIFDFLHPDDVERTRAGFERMHYGQPAIRFPNRYRCKDGSYRWISWIGVPEDGKFYCTGRDITEEREQGEALALRTAERDRLWRLSADILVVMDCKGVFHAVSPAVSKILGWSPDEVVGRTVLDFVLADDIHATAAAFGESSASSLRWVENRCRHKDGSWRWISWVAAPEGELIFATGRHVTAEKEREAELTIAQEALRQAQKMEAVGQLTGGVAHDFNNMLTVIKSSTELLRRPDLPADRRKRYVDAIAETVERASKLTGQLLAFARRQALKPEVFDAEERIETVSEMLRTIMGSRVIIATEFSNGQCWIKADIAQFETALVNLALNARDAMDGEGRLTMGVSSVASMPAGSAQGSRAGPFVAIAITDTGSGIPPAQLGQIFEPFFTTKEVGKGTGLGLSQVYGFTKQSGGDVRVESKQGAGTMFTLYLPQVASAPAIASTPRQQETECGAGGGRRVLVVEDNAEVGQFSTQLLEDLGYQTTWAANAAEALTILEQTNGFDAVFSDVVMPGLSGIELGQEIRRLYPGLPIVLTSGYSHVLAEEGRHGFELLQKPYAVDELSRVLRRVATVRAG